MTETLQRPLKTGSGPVTGTAAILTAPGNFTLRPIEFRSPDAGEVRIRLEGTGVCTSNIPVWEGRDWFNYPVDPGNPGHEGWGVVDAVGEGVSGLATGDRVACLSYNAYATHDITKAELVVKLPESLHGKPFPGEPLGCAMNIFARCDIQPGHTVAIVGAGFLGALLVQLAKSAGANVVAISKRKYSLSTASEMGADQTILMDDHYRIIEEVKELTDGRFCDRVIEATGKEWPLNLSIELTAERGRLVVAGFHQDGMRNINMQLLNWRGIDLISAHERDPEIYIQGIREAIKAIEDGVINPYPLFTHQFPLSQIQTAFDVLSARPEGFIKALIINNK